MFAVDATPTRIAVLEFVDGAAGLRPKNLGWTRSVNLEQSEAEPAAALAAAEQVAAAGSPCPECGLPPLAIIGGDADAVSAAITKGYSNSSVVRERDR